MVEVDEEADAEAAEAVEAAGPARPVRYPRTTYTHIPIAPKIVFKDECMWKDSVFQPECPLAQVNPRRMYTSSSVTYRDFTDDVYRHIIKEKPAFTRECPPETCILRHGILMVLFHFSKNAKRCTPHPY